MSERSFPVPVFVVLLASAALLAPAAYAVPWEVGGLLGLQLPDQELTGAGEGSSEFPPTLGLRGDVYVTENWGIFADGLFSSIGSSKPFGDATMLHARAGAELLYPGQSADHAFYFDTGLGWMNVGPDDADSFDRPYWSLGLGKRWALNETVRLRAEVRGDRTLGTNEDDVIGKTMHQFEMLVGVSWVFGSTAPPPPPPPRDSDRDGVFDDDDACPDTPRGVEVDARGCPKDSDGDGVYDGIDQCPDTPKGVPVDAVGCPKDSDGDGVTDDQDKCPGTPKGVAVDETGCPKAAPLFKTEEEKQALILEGVNFEFNSAILTARSSDVLDRVAESMVAWPDVRVEVGGHTDTVGTAQYNLDLSQRRAASVRDYLVSKGVAADRMEVAGYGFDRPIATNDTAEGRAQNRRVELKKL